MFNDGTELQADVIVFATGFVANLRELVSGYIGKSVADNVDDFWGVDGEGELRAAFKFPGRKFLFCTQVLSPISCSEKLNFWFD
jgi:hypothetical protein